MLDWLREQLIGPASEDEILKGISPLDRYPAGVLHPIIRGEEGLDPASVNDDEDDEYAGSVVDEQTAVTAEPAEKQRRYIPPSSVGFSFFARGDLVRFHVQFSAAHYKYRERDEQGRFDPEYTRIELGGEDDALTFEAIKSPAQKLFSQRQEVMQDKAGVDVKWRPFSDGWIVTVSLFNRQEWEGSGDQRANKVENNKKALFETKLSCHFEEGEVGTYPRVDKSLLTEEEQELELQYRHKHIYAIGHGAAVNWNEEQRKIKEVWSEFMPAVEVPQVTADTSSNNDAVLDLALLAAEEGNPGIPEEVIEGLDQFVTGYSKWVSGQERIAGTLETDEQETAARITSRMHTAGQRMRRGIKLLRDDQLAATSFQIANHAMLEQMRQSDKLMGIYREDKIYRWRPFQLAFLLTVIESAINEEDGFRDIVDLIWFPTGGGKTEAYLGLIAFLIVWRRLKYPAAGGGTAVFMRYTLRLLTAQQYLRATRMICALELTRRRDTEILGRDPITVGMWVGGATSPNRYDQANEIVQQVINGNKTARNKLVLDSCPWCGTPFQQAKNYISTKTQFHFCCTNKRCEFGGHEQGLVPCNVVDEALYEAPPTLLLATVDKFARLAWEERANAFFGGRSNRPPELIIQDELHLIAGALGSVVGLYEASLDTVLIQRGIHPKYVASTATIRMADQQIKRLYGRELAVFPPPGLSSDDSYFARTVSLQDRPGRLYVGYSAPRLNRQKCMAPLAASLLVAPEVVFEEGSQDRDDLLEAWWTQVVYHGSLKGVGNSHNSFNSGVREITRRLAKEICDRKKGTQCADPEIEKTISRFTSRIAQLTSLSSAEDNARAFARLERTRKEEDYLDVVLATNMISVGLDVARLALMIINGQPLTTAEYIQASSRVGRSDVPGMVFTNYYRNQARSLSHYENFRPYHDAFYRFVEPTSVTPYTWQARTRALHAALVITIRHSCSYLLNNSQAGKFNPADDCVQTAIESLKQRCKLADPERAEDTATHIDTLVKKWRDEVNLCIEQRQQLDYQAPDNDRATSRLIYNHDDKIHGVWPTLQSMRHVENSALLKPL